MDFIKKALKSFQSQTDYENQADLDHKEALKEYRNTKDTINCKNDQKAKVTGSNNDLTASRCKTVTIKGNDNTIRHTKDTTVILQGSGNIKILIYNSLNIQIKYNEKPKTSF